MLKGLHSVALVSKRGVGNISLFDQMYCEIKYCRPFAAISFLEFRKMDGVGASQNLRRRTKPAALPVYKKKCK